MMGTSEIFFKKSKKTNSFRSEGDLKKPFERDDFDFLIFFCKKKIKKSKSSLSAPSFQAKKDHRSFQLMMNDDKFYI
jgi:hypothetical protein